MSVPAWLDELRFPTGSPLLEMGLRTIPPDQWLHVDEQRHVELALKRTLTRDRHDEVFAALPGTEDAGREVLDLVVDDLSRRGIAVQADAGLHPLEAAGLLVQEDLCLMVERDGAPYLDAASLCFPSHWRLGEKIGRPAAAIHGPVPQYATELEPKVDRYLTRLSAGRIAVRRNWSLNDNDLLFAPTHPDPVEVSLEEAGERLWIRSERQTLRRLPETGAVLFTIRVQQAPLGVLAERPDLRRSMAASARASAVRDNPRVNGPHFDVAVGWLEGSTALS